MKLRVDSVQKLAEIFPIPKNLDGECWVNMPVSSIRDCKVCVNFFTFWASEVKISIEKPWGKHWQFYSLGWSEPKVRKLGLLLQGETGMMHHSLDGDFSSLTRFGILDTEGMAELWPGLLPGRVSESTGLGGDLPGDSMTGELLHPEELAWIADAAIARWGETEFAQNSGVDWQGITFHLEDLPGTIVGQAQGNRIAIDPIAGGYGWFVDPTPFEDEEFTAVGERLLGDRTSPAFDRLDLLTVVSHEIGHVLGLDDLNGADAHLMNWDLVAGERRLPSEPGPMDFLAATDLDLAHNLQVGFVIQDVSLSQYIDDLNLNQPLQTALFEGFQTLFTTLDENNDTFGGQLFSLPGLVSLQPQNNSENNNESLSLPGLLGNQTLGNLIETHLFESIQTDFSGESLTDLGIFINSLSYDTPELKVGFGSASFTLTAVESTPDIPDDYELGFDFSVRVELQDEFKLDLGKNASFYGIDIDLDSAANVLLNSDVTLDFSLGTGLTLTQGNFGGESEEPDTKFTLDDDNVFIRNAELRGTAAVNDPNVNFDLQVGFLDLQVENGQIALNGNFAANLVDPNNQDGLNRITLDELKNTPSEVLTEATARGTLQMELPLEVKGIPGLPGEFLAVEDATITVNADLQNLLENSALPSGTVDPRMSLPITVSEGFTDFLTPFTAISGSDLIGSLQRLSNDLGKMQRSQGLGLEIPSESDGENPQKLEVDIPFTQNKSLGEVLGISQGLDENLIQSLTDEQNVPKFDSVQEFAVKLAEILPINIADINPRFDSESQEIRFDVKVTSNQENPVEIGFDGEVSDLAEVRTQAEGKVRSDLDLDFTLGIQLEGESPEIAVMAIASEAVKTGTLKSDAVFSLKLGNNPPVEIVVAATATIADVEEAIAAAGLGDRVQVKFMSEGKGFFLTSNSPLLQVVNANETAKQQLGLEELQTAASLAMINQVGDNIGLPTTGPLPGDVVFMVTLDTENPVTVTVSPDGNHQNAADRIAALIADFNAGLATAGLSEKLVAGRIGDRLILAATGENTQLGIHAISDAAIQIGIAENFVARTRSSVDSFIENAEITGNVNLLADQIQGEARFGFVGIEMAGSDKDDGIWDADVTGEVKIALGHSPETTRFVLGKPSNSEQPFAQLTQLDWSGDVNLRNISVNTGLTGLNGTGLNLPITVSNSSVLGVPEFSADWSQLEELAKFQTVDFAAIVESLQDVSQFLSDRLQGFDALQTELPLVGMKIGDLLTWTDRFATVVNDFEQNPSSIVQDLNSRLVEALELPPGSDLVSFAYNPDSSLLTLEVNFIEKLRDSLPIEFDLGAIGEQANVQLKGAAGLQASGNATAKLSLGIDLTDAANPVSFLNLAETELGVEFAARGENLSFVGAIGPVGLHINNGVAAIDGDGDAATTDDFMKVAIALTPPIGGETQIRLSELDQIQAEVTVTGGVDATLPIFFPTASQFLGNLEFSIADLSQFIADPTNPNSVEVKIPDLSSLLDNLDFGLLSNLPLAIDGIDLFLAGVQGLLSGEVLGVELPLIGDKFAEEANFIQDIRTDLYEGLRTTLDNATNLSGELLQTRLFEILGPDGQNLLLKSSEDKSKATNVSDIRLSGDGTEFQQWEMTLGGEYKIDEKIAFDLGFPALNLNLDGGVDLTLDWSLDLGFGLNKQEGFYILLSDETAGPELEINLTATLPDLSLTGNLGFFTLEVKDSAEDPTQLTANFAVDLFQKNAPGPQTNKIGFSDIGKLGMTPTLNADAVVNLNLEAFVGASLLPEEEDEEDEENESTTKNTKTAVLPKLVSDFNLEWNLDTSDPAKTLGKFETLAFNNIGLDLGSFFSDFLQPTLGKIEAITKPIQPVLDVLTNPIPVISDLAGRDITLVDLAEAFGPQGNSFGMIKEVEQIKDLMAKVKGMAETETWEIGDFSLLSDSTGQESDQANNAEGLDLADLVIANSAHLSAASKPDSVQEIQNGDYGSFAFPILEHPSNVIGLLLGTAEDVPLVTYDMAPLNFEFEYSEFFPILLVLGAEIKGTIGASIDLGFGFDTYGGQQFAAGNYKYPLDIFRGFYISDRINADGTGPDVAELVLWGSLVASAALHLGLAKGGVGGGIFATIEFDLNDPNDDGKVRIEEILNNLYLGNLYIEKNKDSTGLDLLKNNPITSVFDVSGLVTAQLEWFVEVGKKPLKWEDSGKIGEALPLLDFDFAVKRDPVLATNIGDGVLRLNMGDYAGDRLHKNTTDGDEHFTVTQDGDTIIVEAFDVTQTYTGVNHIVAYGGSGDDTLIFKDVRVSAEIDGGFGNDLIDWSGSEGNVTIRGGSGSDTLLGGKGNDLLMGEQGADFIFGGSGDNTLDGGSGNDLISGGDGNNVIFGGEGDDTIGGGANHDYIDGGDGDDRIWGDSTFDLNGVRTPGNLETAGADTISGGPGNDLIFGEGGDDLIGGGSGNDTIEGNEGDDEIWGDSEFKPNGDRIAPLRGQEGNDIINGNEGNDRIFGEGGNDSLRGDSGDDTLDGGFGQDTLFGDEGNDSLDGGPGNDIIFGGAGDDRITGNSGQDIIFGDKGLVASLGDDPDSIDDDTFVGDADPNLLLGYIGDGDRTSKDIAITQIDATDGNDTIDGGGGDDLIFGGTGDDFIFGDILPEAITGETPTGNDILIGDGGKVFWHQQRLTRIQTTDPEYGGNDTIGGNEGDDIIFGSAGNDSLMGGHGENTPTTGPNNDIILGDSGQIDYQSGEIIRIQTTDPEYGGNDTISGNEGDDIIIGGSANDSLNGNDGNDIILGDNGEIIGNDGSSKAFHIFSTSPEFGGIDIISGNNGDDIIIGGSGGLDASGLGGDYISGNDGDDIILGDNAWIHRNADLEIERIETIFPEFGGDDVIFGNDGGDIIIGGFGQDTLDGAEGPDIILGDNGLLDYTPDGNLATLNLVTVTDPTLGDADVIYGGDGNDLIFGGTSGDWISAGNDHDLVFGDHGKVVGVIDLTQLPLNQLNPPFIFTSIYTQNADRGGDDIIYGGSGDDILLGGQGKDMMFGEEGNDDLIGGHNVAGGDDSDDTLDGGPGHDVIAGDNAVILRSPDSRNPRMRVLSGELLYDAEGNPLITDESQPNPDRNPERIIRILDHHKDTSPNHFGHDWIAGGGGDDMIFGQLGNDTIQGDSSVYQPVSLTTPSRTGEDDGHDYIEGGGGDDLIFGNSGPDDIIGGSSSLFGNDTPDQRPDGKDTIFGGSGTAIERNHPGDESPEGHARDADVIAGDNANIFRLVGTNGINQGQFLTFNYDNYSDELRIIPRVVELLDYDPENPENSIGDDDLIYGEDGDDVIYGMTGNDVLFGNGQDDDIFGGIGHDRIYGGTGDDGILGDDGRIFTSRNGETEPLYGLTTPNLQTNISIPGPFIGAIIHETGRLKKEARLIAFEFGGNDIIYGGLGDDFLHGGSGDDAISGAEALPEFYNADPVTNFNPLGYDPVTRKFAAYDALNPRQKIEGFFLNFEAVDADGNKIDDGMDHIFGGNGNDWLVGGTNRDRLFGGMGDDLINADDNHDTNGGLNDRPDDPEFADADFAFGGGGLDVLIANTGGDRLFDWTGEFNSFIVPFSPFGAPTITRSISPHVVQFLLDLGLSSGADSQLIEPYGELGLVTQQDPQWGDQHGPPRDPQPGNIPGVQRDTQGAPEGTEDATPGNGNNPGNNGNNPGNNGNNPGNNPGNGNPGNNPNPPRNNNPGVTNPIFAGVVTPNASPNASPVAGGQINPIGNPLQNSPNPGNPTPGTPPNTPNNNNNGSENNQPEPEVTPTPGTSITVPITEEPQPEVTPTPGTSITVPITEEPQPEPEATPTPGTSITVPITEEPEPEVTTTPGTSITVPITEDDNNPDPGTIPEEEPEPVAEATPPEDNTPVVTPEPDPIPPETIIVQQTYTSNDVNLGIPDPGILRSTLTIPNSGTILDINIQLSLNHNRNNDLQVFLENPQGNRVQLFANVGGNSNTFANLTLDDQASLPVTAAANPNITTFRPQEELALFNGLPLAGLWTLEVHDTRQQQSGILNNWSLIVTHQNH